MRAAQDLPESLEVLTGSVQGKQRRAVYAGQVYNDLGTEKDHRDTLGGSKWPYPRRERTGRPEKGADFLPALSFSSSFARLPSLSRLKGQPFSFS